ncbi:MAG TPA: hypothetical protein VEU06_10895 [Micropepsaceae bacterium]|jgi:hypothetical protein|nr:hypothetical protein [Micropepsaceae bacterium]
MRPLVVILLSAIAAPAVAQDKPPPPPALPFDTPVSMRAIEVACTGIGADSRNDPRWKDFPLKIELVGKDGQFLGDTVVTLIKGDEELASVNCGGPWILFRVMPGAYSVTAETEGIKQMSKVTVRDKGQARVVMSFPSLGGAIAPP